MSTLDPSEFTQDSDLKDSVDVRASLYEFCLAEVADMPDDRVLQPEWMIELLCNHMGLPADHPMRRALPGKRPATVGELRARWRALLVGMGRLSDESLTVLDGARRLR